MSLDIYLKEVCENCGHKTVYDWNYTYNMSFAWTEAGILCREWEGKRCSELLEEMKRGVEEIKNHPEKYGNRNPENGWGKYETLVPRLEELLEKMIENPEAIFTTWR